MRKHEQTFQKEKTGEKRVNMNKHSSRSSESPPRDPGGLAYRSN